MSKVEVTGLLELFSELSTHDSAEETLQHLVGVIDIITSDYSNNVWLFPSAMTRIQAYDLITSTLQDEWEVNWSRELFYTKNKIILLDQSEIEHYIYLLRVMHTLDYKVGDVLDLVKV